MVILVFCVFGGLRLEVIVCFVDIDGVVDHHCLNFLFIIISGKQIIIKTSYFHWTSLGKKISPSQIIPDICGCPTDLWND
jgi:hypothetical protein